MEKDVDVKVGVGAIDQPENAIRLDKMPGEELRSLKMTKHFELAESVRLLGYNQGGEGIFEKGRHISPSVEYVEGQICRHFKATMSEESLASGASSTVSPHQVAFAPREEIVIMECYIKVEIHQEFRKFRKKRIQISKIWGKT